jgi:hypothetical protein
MIEIRACLTANENWRAESSFLLEPMTSPKWALDTLVMTLVSFCLSILKRHFKSGSVSSIGSGRYWAIDEIEMEPQGATVNKLKIGICGEHGGSQVPWVCHKNWYGLRKLFAI